MKEKLQKIEETLKSIRLSKRAWLAIGAVVVLISGVIAGYLRESILRRIRQEKIEKSCRQNI